ncbi:MAG: glycine betaine ABC transporter substrate-binding protein [Solirubrobacteraceae bacterium]
MRKSRSTFVLGFLGALCAAVALAACGSSSSSSGSSSSSTAPTKSPAGTGPSSATGPGKGKPAITIGDKNFTEEYILGELYAQALRGQGYSVTVKKSIGSSEIIDKALTSGQIQMYPEYVGTILSVLEGKNTPPASEAATYADAKRFETKRGFTLLSATPYYNVNSLATLPSFAQKSHLTTISDLKKVGAFSYADTPENLNRLQGVAGLKKVYGLTKLKFVPLSIGLQYPALEKGNVQTADVFSTDAQLSQTKLTILTDDKHIFGFQNVAPVVSEKALKAEGPAFAQTIDAVSAKLTIPAVRSMNAAADLNKEDPAAVATAFLKANKLG